MTKKGNKNLKIKLNNMSTLLKCIFYLSFVCNISNPFIYIFTNVSRARYFPFDIALTRSLTPDVLIISANCCIRIEVDITRTILFIVVSPKSNFKITSNKDIEDFWILELEKDFAMHMVRGLRYWIFEKSVSWTNSKEKYHYCNSIFIFYINN